MIKSLHKVIREYKSFFYFYFLFMIVVGIILLIYSKEETFFFVNANYNTVWDVFFKGLTHLGDGLLFILIALVLAIYRYRLAVLGILIFLSSSFIVQVLKRTLFDDIKRPIGHFGIDSDLHLVEGVTRHVSNSFPSGHATTIFALSLFLVLVFNLKKSGWLMAVLAILVAYSRVYLAVHFPVDVFVGSFIGIASALGIYIWLNDPLKSKFGDKSLMVKK